MTPTKKAKWTVMVYMAGDNNLDSAALRDIAEMAKVGSSRDVHIVVQLDRDKDLLTRRFYITKDGGYEKDCVLIFDETNTGDPEVLENFILWTFHTYPARRYFLILWNHGGGWWEETGRQRSGVSGQRVKKPRGIFKKKSPTAKRNIAYDDTSGDALDNQELKNVLLRVSQRIRKKIDILGMDACLMNIIEVAHQLKDSVELIVGSEEVEPFDGWPYDRILQVLKNRPRSWPTTIAKTVVREYIKSYERKEENVTQSALHLEHIEPVGQRLDELSVELISSLQNSEGFKAITSSRKNSPNFFWNNYIDLRCFAENLEARSSQESVKKAASALIGALRPGRGRAILCRGHSGEKVQNTHGMSIYFPSSWVNPAYTELDFYKDCAWGKFLEAYLGQ